MRLLPALVLLVACRPAAPPAAPADPVAPSAPSATSSAHAFGRSGMVASDAPLASLAGVEILRAGGNAADAAVAVGFALAVVYPEAGNLGGGGFALVRMADGRTAVADYREVAPLAATRDMYFDTTRSSTVGPWAIGVPGAVAGLVATHERFGRLPFARVIAPAIRLASEGFVVDSQLAHSLASGARLIGQFAGASVFLPGGQPLRQGDTLRLPALARTLRLIADSAQSFYTGGLAREVAADLAAVGSIVTAEDLARYKVEWREPLRATYRGRTLLTPPPPSSGVALVQALNILEGFSPMPPHGSVRHYHLIASALQRAFIERNARIADPAFVTVPVSQMAKKPYAARLRATIGDRATPTSALMPAMLTPANDGDHTTHYSVVDREGNVVATTTTINDLYGSGVYLPTVGIFMNDEMDDFATRPGAQNLYELIQSDQNAVQPGKRMLSSMIPTIVIDRDGKPLLALGARGGPRIISAVLQTIVNVVDYDLPLHVAVDAPRVHHQALPDSIRVERARPLPPAVQDSLVALGYHPWEISHVAMLNAVRIGAWLEGVVDKRSGGRPAGY